MSIALFIITSMKRKGKLISGIGIFYLFFLSVSLQAQNASTYYDFGPGVNNPNNFVTDSVGNFYFVNYDVNWNLQISRLTPQGVVSVIVSGNYNPQNLTLDNAGNLYFINQSNWPYEIIKITPDGTLSSFVSGNYYPQYLTSDNLGNLFFLDQMNWPYEIKKVTPDGTISSFVSGDFYPQNLTVDNLGNLYFIDQNNWPYEIKKITPDGTLSSFVTGNYYPQSMVTDNSGNVYFIDQMNWPYDVKKVTSDGTVSSFVTGNYYPQSMVTDSSGNLYFIDQMNWPNEIQKVTPDGTVSSFVSGYNNPQNMLIDHSGNLNFIDNSNGPYAIMTAIQPGYVCTAPGAPVTANQTVCSGSSITVNADGIGAIKWYDAPVGGNLVNDGRSFSTPPLLVQTTYYAEGVFCGLSSPRSAVAVALLTAPTAAIAGTLTGNDYVSLTASGGVSYEWSGGTDVTLATNTFIRSGFYTVTVTNELGCSNTAAATITINKFGVTSYGQLSNAIPDEVNNYGRIGSATRVNKHGKISSSAPADGSLQYQVFTSSASYANNANEFAAFTNPANQTSSGMYDASTLLNWSNWGMLTAKGIAVPNGGDRFSVVASGFFVPDESGVYTFTCEGDDAVDLFINGVNVANHYGAHGIAGLGSHTGTITLSAGTRYSFRARMQENGGGEGLLVFWRKPSENSGWNINTGEISSN
jgi:hypothetical protein